MRKLLSTKTSPNAFALGTLILRVGISVLMIMHGYDKLTHFTEYTSKFQDPFHISPSFSFSLLVFAEFFCSAFLILGLFTRFACIPLIIAMLVALGSAHKWEVFGNGQAAALFLLCYLVIFAFGPGRISLDRALGK